MNLEVRMSALHAAIETTRNDNVRYSVGAKLRELGYIDIVDFLDAQPPSEHVAEIERVLQL
jgi:hypothetical protein